MTTRLHSDVQELTDELIATRRDLHQHPELAFEEYRTAGIVAQRLGLLGFQVQTGVAKTGVVGTMEFDRPGKTLMIRADMDALPVQEIEGRSYGSLTPGKMHACGHDGHTSVALMVAGLLANHRSALKGKIKMVFQPAEEIVAGAKLMMEEGVLKDSVPDRILGFHCWPVLETGKVGIHTGPMWAAVDQIRLLVKGQGSHGGMPHLAADPLLAGAHIVVALQTLFSREISTFQPATFSQGVFNAGNLYNVIPSEAELWGSCRSFDPSVREFMHRRIREITEGIAATFRCTGTMEIGTNTPAVINDANVAAELEQAAIQVAGADNVVDPGQSTVGDDIAYFLQEVPGCYFLLGVGNSDKGSTAPLHSPQFDIDEIALPIAAETLATAAIQFLS